MQRSEEDPTIFGITYQGSHTCKGNDAVKFRHAQSSQEESLITKYTNTLTVKTDNNITAHPFSASFGCMTQDILNDPNFLSTHSQTSLLSPNTPESNYYVSPSFLVHEFDGVCHKPCLDSDAAGIVLADTSTTNFPIFDFDLSLDQRGIDDSNFPFNAPGFLS